MVWRPSVLIKLLVLAAFVAGSNLRSEPARANDPFQILDAIVGQGMRQHRDRETYDRNRAAPRAHVVRPGQDEPLTSSETMSLQKALVDLGYDIGRPDGRPGRRTGQAISDFLRSKGLDPYEISPKSALRLAQNEASRTGERPVSKAVAVAMSVPSGPIAGEALFLDPTTSQYRNYYDDDAVATAKRQENERLALLFILKSDPTRLDDKAWTLDFVPIIDPALTSTLVGHAMSEKAGYDWDSRHYIAWRGEDQFEQEDRRQEFLKLYKQRILSELERLPTKIKMIWAISYGKYDETTQVLGVTFSNQSSYGVPHTGSNVGLGIALPFALPTEWKLSPSEARQTLAQSRPKPGSRAASFAAGSFTIKAVRPKTRGAIIDLEFADDLKVYDSIKLQRQIAVFPLLERQMAGSGTTANGVYLDAMFPRLWAVSKDETLLRNAAFLRETFRLRKIMEKQARDTKGQRPTNWPFAIPSGLLSTNLEPGPDDLQAFSTWMRTNSGAIGDRAKITGVNIWPVNAEKTRSRDLHSSFEFNGDYSGRDRDWITPAVAAAKAAFPDSIDFKILWNGDGVPALVALSPHPAWYALDIDLSKSSYVADMWVSLKEFKEVEIGGDRKVLVLNVEPEAIEFPKSSGKADIKFEGLAKTATEPTSAGRYDIAGVRLGMPLEDAVSAVKAFAPDQLKEISLKLNDPIFAHSKTFERRASDNTIQEVIRLFYDDGQTERPVIAVGRFLQLKDFNTTEQAAASLTPRLETKYGKSSRLYDGDLYWSSDPVTAKRILSNFNYQDPCHHSNYRNFYDANSSGMWSSQIMASCGEVLSAKIHYQSLVQFLLNTNVFARMRKRLEQMAEPVKDPAENVKF